MKKKMYSFRLPLDFATKIIILRNTEGEKSITSLIERVLRERFKLRGIK